MLPWAIYKDDMNPMEKNAAMVTEMFVKLGVLITGLGLLIIMALALIWFLRRGRAQEITSEDSSISKYRLNDSLLTPAEKLFMNCLDSILPREVRVFAKVRVADILSVDASGDRSQWQTSFNKINSKHVDYLLCRSDDFLPLAVIELDDKTHQKEKRQSRDDFLNAAFEEANLPIIRIRVQQNYNPQVIANQINKALVPANVQG